MYLRYIRHKHPCGTIHRGTLYSVHFQPNEKGGYNEFLTPICQAYEMVCGTKEPPALIYTFSVTKNQSSGRMLLRYGMGAQQAQIYLLGIEQVYADMLIEIQREHIECRIEIEELKWNWLFPSMYYEGNWGMMVIISDYTKGNRLCSVILANGKIHLLAKLQGNDLYRSMRRKIEAQHKGRIIFGKTNIINPSHGRENKQCRNNHGRN